MRFNLRVDVNAECGAGHLVRSTKNQSNGQNMEMLFLDLDGILHTLNGRAFEKMPLLQAWLLKWPGVHVVLSSSWREANGLERLKASLGPQLADRVLAQTSLARVSRWDQPAPYPRQKEIEQYLHQTALNVRAFAVLDDDPTLFEPLWPPLHLSPPDEGITDRQLDMVAKTLKLCNTEGARGEGELSQSSPVRDSHG